MLIFLFLLLFVSLLLYSNGYINHIRYTSKVTCNKSIKLTAWDKEIAKGQEYLDKIAKKKELKMMKPEDLGVDVTPRIHTLKVVEPPTRSAGVIVADVKALVDKLKNEAKVI
jgi:hypothetical protein